jgi:HAD superfamily hydrolase (TIGR01509 family)
MLKAVIFDLDGVIADSHPIHEAAWKTLFAEQGLDAENLNLDFLYAGQPRGEIFHHFFGQLPDAKFETLSRRKDVLYTALVGALQPKPGLVRVLGELAAAGIVMAVGTSAQRRRTLETLDHFGIAGRFGAVVTGDDVGATKPAPEIFLRAAELIHAQPSNTVVVEDSHIGIEAARAAGMKCVGYAPPARIEQLRQAGADDLILEFPPSAVEYFSRIAGLDAPPQGAANQKAGSAAPGVKGV